MYCTLCAVHNKNNAHCVWMAYVYMYEYCTLCMDIGYVRHAYPQAQVYYTFNGSSLLYF